MRSQAYDQKNQEDFEKNSELLTKALLEIQNSKKFKATISQLSKMTGMHRNTISSRMWPVQKLKEIKESRAEEFKKKEERERRNSVDKKALLEEQLDQARKEVIYWFNESEDNKRFYEHSDKRFRQMRDARDHYKNLYETEKKKLLATEQELGRLRALLELR